MGTIPCHRSLAGLAGDVEHPGLFFDRYMAYEDAKFNTYSQELQRPHLQSTIEKMTRVARNAEPTLLEQWLPPSLSCGVLWQQTTIWRMTMHLSRAAATENASVCLHPVYGFPYIPGTGLKGMTRAYAHLVLDKKEDDPDVQRIFGSLSRGAGTVIFHDAWPEKWPKLELDIVNSHHPEYYKKEGEGSPPGDWENPIPVFFLAIAPATTFRFAVMPLSALSEHKKDMQTAAEWLQQALQELGAGGKTAAGYGYFSAPPVEEPPKPTIEQLREENTAFSAAQEEYSRLLADWARQGGYIHSEHNESMRGVLTKMRQALGAPLPPDIIQQARKAAKEKLPKSFNKMIDKIQAGQ